MTHIPITTCIILLLVTHLCCFKCTNSAIACVLTEEDLTQLVSSGILTSRATAYLRTHYAPSAVYTSGHYLPTPQKVRHSAIQERLFAHNNSFKLDFASFDLVSLDGYHLPWNSNGRNNNYTQLRLDNNSLLILDGALLPQNLTHLSAKRNQLTQLRNLCLLDELKELNLAHNKLGFLGNKGLRRIKFPESLTTLDLSYNNIKSLKDIQFPPNLITLDLSGNPIEKFADGIWPPYILNLDLSYNRKLNSDLFASILFPYGIEKIWANYCALTSLLAIGFRQYKNLAWLSMNDNFIYNLEQVQFPMKLRRLSLNNNPISDTNIQMWMNALKYVDKTCYVSYGNNQRAYYKSPKINLKRVQSLEHLLKDEFNLKDTNNTHTIKKPHLAPF